MLVGDFAHAFPSPSLTAWAKSQMRCANIEALRQAILPTLL
jgi:hypothetical protein